MHQTSIPAPLAELPVIDYKAQTVTLDQVKMSQNDYEGKRAGEIGLTFQPDQFSTVFWDVFGQQGHPVRATVRCH